MKCVCLSAINGEVLWDTKQPHSLCAIMRLAGWVSSGLASPGYKLEPGVE